MSYRILQGRLINSEGHNVLYLPDTVTNTEDILVMHNNEYKILPKGTNYRDLSDIIAGPDGDGEAGIDYERVMKDIYRDNLEVPTIYGIYHPHYYNTWMISDHTDILLSLEEFIESRSYVIPIGTVIAYGADIFNISIGRTEQEYRALHIEVLYDVDITSLLKECGIHMYRFDRTYYPTGDIPIYLSITSEFHIWIDTSSNEFSLHPTSGYSRYRVRGKVNNHDIETLNPFIISNSLFSSVCTRYTDIITN